MLILGIESSCDETAAALVQDGVKEISSSVSSSSELHEKTGGIVPEIAARKQVEYIVPVIAEVITQGAKEIELTQEELISKIDAIAVTVGPGLIGSLVVGVEAAKSLCLAWNKPLIPVNHLIGHVYSSFVHAEGGASASSQREIEFPAVALVVSGGHTDLVLMHNHCDFEYLGGTLDDAAGEAFDKTARLLGLSSYKLGGPEISKAAAKCSKNTLAGQLPRPMLNKEGYDFSFSGLKTAVRYLAGREEFKDALPVNEIACEFETAAVDVLVGKTILAAKEFNAKSILLGGGVVANTPLRSRMDYSANEIDVPVFYPPIRLCGDSAVYIASAAFFCAKDSLSPIDFEKVKADPSLGILD